MENKRYYWIKLKTDFFERDDIDFILSQKNGCQYIVLYQMLCMKSVNNGGVLGTKIDEMIIPYNIEKIIRDTKYFDFDTVSMALGLFKQLGLIYEEENGILKIMEYDDLVGSETASTIRSRKCRENQKMLQSNNNATLSQRPCNTDIDIDIDKEKDIDIDIDINNMSIIYNWDENKKCECITGENRVCMRRSCYNINNKNYCNQHSKKVLGNLYKETTNKFVKPTLEEVQQYCNERNNNIDAQKFIDYYESIGWKVGKSPMKDWKACVRTWENNSKSKQHLSATEKFELGFEEFKKQIEEEERKGKAL